MSAFYPLLGSCRSPLGSLRFWARGRMCVAPARMASDCRYKGAQEDAAQLGGRVQSGCPYLISQCTKIENLALPPTPQPCASSKLAHVAMSTFFSRSGVDTFTFDNLAAEYHPSFFPSNGEGIRTLGVSFTGAIRASCSLTYFSICRASSVKGVLKRGKMSGSLKAPTAQSAALQPRAMTTTTTTLSDSEHEGQRAKVPA